MDQGHPAQPRQSRRRPASGKRSAAPKSAGSSLAARINAQSAAQLGSGGVKPEPAADDEAAAPETARPGSGDAPQDAASADAQQDDPPMAEGHSSKSAEQQGYADDAQLQAALAASTMDAGGWQVAPPGSGFADDDGTGPSSPASDQALADAPALPEGKLSSVPANPASQPARQPPPRQGRAAASADAPSQASAETQPLPAALQFLEDIGAVTSPPRSGRKRSRQQNSADVPIPGAINPHGSNSAREDAATAPAAAQGLQAPTAAGPMEVDLPAARQQPPDCVDLASAPPANSGPQRANGGGSSASGALDAARRQDSAAADAAGSHSTAAGGEAVQHRSSSAHPPAATGQADCSSVQQQAVAAGSGAPEDAAGPSDPALAELLGVLGSALDREQVWHSVYKAV
jgi:hypothetical protein